MIRSISWKFRTEWNKAQEDLVKVYNPVCPSFRRTKSTKLSVGAVVAGNSVSKKHILYPFTKEYFNKYSDKNEKGEKSEKSEKGEKGEEVKTVKKGKKAKKVKM